MSTSPKMTDKLIAELRERAADLGFVLSGRCRWCMRPISSLRSLKNRAGPSCSAKHKKSDRGNSGKNSPTIANRHQ